MLVIFCPSLQNMLVFMTLTFKDRLGMGVHICNPSTREVEAGGW
jgi:hypothetical protein